MTTDDDLLLYHYRDGLGAAERARIGAALAEQPELAHRLHVLVARLDAAADALPDVPVPPQVQQRWQAALDDVGSTTQAARPGRSFPGRWLAVAATVAGLAIVLAIFSAQPPVNHVAGDALPAVAPSRDDASAYERGLTWHLASTERQIAGIGSATPEQRARLVETIVAQNRMYALAAERAGEPQLARVLRAFAPVLESLTHEGSDNSANIAQLGFELRVIQGRLRAGADAPNDQSTAL